MKISYYSETDTLSIALRPGVASTESSEVAEDVVVDYDVDGNVVALEVDLASTKVDLGAIRFS